MRIRPEWQQETRIRSYEAGTSGKANIATICNLLQECAAAHADHLGISYEYMHERQLAWAVSRIGVEVKRKPVVREALTVRTWINGTRGPFAMREFVVLDARSLPVVRATYAWLAVDTRHKRPVRPQQLMDGYPPPPDRPSLEAALGKVPDPESPIVLDPVRTRESDIDMHLHVNNTRYIAWIEDAIAAGDGEPDVVWLQVNFLAEAFSGETICVKAGTGAQNEGRSGKIVVLSREEDGVEFVRGLAVFGKYREQPGSTPEKSGETISEETLAAASKIAGIQLTPPERAQALQRVAGFSEAYEKRRTVTLENNLGPAEVFVAQEMWVPQRAAAPAERRQPGPPVPEAIPDFPKSKSDLAFAPLRDLSGRLRRGEVTSTELCELYLERLKRYDPVLSCVVTLTEERAFEQAKRADDELRRGRYRGPLHGIPWGAKDLLDTSGIPTTWGAAPYQERIPESDAVVIRMMEDAGAVLLGKLALGALAYGDIWFGGKTKNPWNISQGSSGSSCGPAAAAVAGLAGFCIGSETMGSIVSPCLRCGAAGLRPSFGMVPRTGSMSLSWSYDKLGPICRYVDDLGYVLEAIAGTDPEDPGSRHLPFAYNPEHPVEGMKIGFHPEWFANHTSLFETMSGTLTKAGAEMVAIELPDLPYEALFNLIVVDAAAAFEELTLSDRDDELVRQDSEAWPNAFRAARFFPAVEYVQLQRFRRLVCREIRPLFDSVDALVSPENRSDLLVITNSTGQPSLTLRAGFRGDGTPFGINLWGRYAGELSICRIGAVLEDGFAAAGRRPPDFC